VRELGAGADAELAVDARQRRLDGVHGEEEGISHLAIRAALGYEVRDSALGFGQLVPRRRAASDARELGARLVGPERCTEAFEACKGVLERCPGGAAPFRATLGSPEREQGARVLERIRALAVFG
jgi:hypothetical protein